MINRREFVTGASLTALMAQAGKADAAQSKAAQVESTNPSAPDSETRWVDSRSGAHKFRVDTAHKRPNIFVVCCDMITPDHYLPTRSLFQEMELPTIRGLMSDGVQFTNAFCTTPVCSPSRASLWTGRHPYVLGLGGNVPLGQDTILRDDDVIFPEYLKAIGYRTKHVGKNHTGARKFMDAFGEQDSNYAGAMPNLRTDEAYHAYLDRLGIKQLPRYSKGRQIWCLDQDRKTPRRSMGGWIEQTDGKPCPAEGQYTHYLCQWANQRVGEALKTPEQPLYLQLNIYDPHNPFTIPDGFQQQEAHMRKVVTLPPSYLRTYERNFKPEPGEPVLLDFHRKFWGMYEKDTATNYRVALAVQMEVIDRALSHFIKNLKDQNIYDESWIFFTADHGEMNMHHALVDKGCYLQPEIQRVPFVVKPPKSMGIKTGIIPAPVSLLDIGATVCDVAGVTPEDRFDGRSLVPYLRRESDFEDRDLVFQASWLNNGNPACATAHFDSRNDRHHFYVYNLASNSDELYDLNDPDTSDIASDPNQKDVLKEMVQRMDGALGDDPRFRYYKNPLVWSHYDDLPKSHASNVRPQRDSYISSDSYLTSA